MGEYASGPEREFGVVATKVACGEPCQGQPDIHLGLQIVNRNVGT
jgi:hypothetical protein